MNLYNLRIVGPGHFAMAKFDPDFNVEAVYNLIAKGIGYTCDCPANNRSVVLKPCKHKRMIPLMMGAVNTDRFYDPEKGQWHQPLASEASGGEAQAPLVAEGEQRRVGSEEPPKAVEPTGCTIAKPTSGIRRR